MNRLSAVQEQFLTTIKLMRKNGEITEVVEFNETTYMFTRSVPGRVLTIIERYDYKGLRRTQLVRDYQKQGYISEAELTANVST